MKRQRRRFGRLESSVNVTPMADVSLSLLLGFLVITPIIIETMSANLPQGGGVSSGQTKQDPLVVYTAEQKLLIDGKEITMEELPAKIEELFPSGSLVERKVMFTGAGEVSYDDIIAVLDRLRDLGVETFGIR